MSYVWTNEKPTVPGWYWYRANEERDSFIAWFNGGRGFGTHDMVNLHGQWAGPIDEPKEA